MKISLFILPFLLTISDNHAKVTPPDGPGFIVSYSINPYLSPNATPMYFPISDTRINLVCPQGLDLGSIKLPNLNIKQKEISTAVTLSNNFYQKYAKFVGANESQLKAAHNMAISITKNAIATGAISKGCTAEMKIVIDGLQDKLIKRCLADPQKAKVTCVAALALKNTWIKKAAQSAAIKGCKVTTEIIGKNIVKLVIITYDGLDNSVEEAKYWLAYMNSVGGMIFIENHIH